jgi:hypothetical protein
VTDTSAPSFPTEISDVDAMLAALNEIVEEAPKPEEEEPEPVAAKDPYPHGVDEHGNDIKPDEPEVAIAPPGTIEFEGQYLPIDEVRALLALNDRLKAEPETAQRVADAISPKTAPVANVLPDWVDPEDTTAVKLYEEVQAAKAETARLQAQNAQVNERDQRAKVVDSFRSAVSSFKAQYPHLTDEQIAKVADLTGRANIVEGLERSEGSLTAAFEKGMTMTLWSDPTLRSLVAEPEGAKVKSKSDRKQKQSALSGSGGSVPRNRETRVAKTRDELMANMLDHVRSDPDLAGS